jgi:hypothetical protein
MLLTIASALIHFSVIFLIIIGGVLALIETFKDD